MSDGRARGSSGRRRRPEAEGTPALSLREMRRAGRALPKRLTFTREGRLIFALTLGIGVGAINTGNNLLYLVLGMLLSLIIVSGVLSDMSLRGLRVRRSEGRSLRVGEATLVPVSVTNTKRRFKALSLEVEELVPPGAQGQLETRRGYVLMLRPGDTETAWVRLRPSRRGRVTSAGLRIATRFPFGFFAKSRFYPLPGEYLVHPQIRVVPRPALPSRVEGAETRVAKVGAGDEFWGIRDHRQGEDARRVAWKASARKGELLVREHERPATREAELVVVNVVPPRESARDAFEQVVAHAASLASQLAAEGWAVGLSTAEGRAAPDTGPQALARVDRALAELPVRAVASGTRIPGVADRAGGVAGRGRVERIAVLTVDQARARLPIDSDHTVVVDAQGEVVGASPGVRRGEPGPEAREVAA